MPIDVAAHRARHSAFGRNVHCLLGLPLDAVDLGAAAARIREAAARRTPCFVSTPNLNFLVGCRADDAWRDSVIASDLNIADGMPLVWSARLLGIPLPERVAGADLFEQLRQENGRRLSVYFFGGGEGVAQAASRRLNAERGGVVCAGFESPGRGSVEELSRPESIARINASGADFLVVALGAKKGQAWIERNLARLSVPVVSHLGAALNFAAGTLERAPAWMRRAGLEWLWRIRQEAWLWRRYFADGLAFLRLLLTRVLPYAWLLRRHPPSREELDAAAIDLHDTGPEIVIRLRGAWAQQNLAPLRACFSGAARLKRHLRLDLSRVSCVDSAFLGLALLLYGAQKKQLRRLACEPVSPTVQKIFEYGCAGFLLTARDDSPLEAPEVDGVALEHEE
jgi:N-acetylglucosaminyldiphosphoundecaprenol N-acetyl-beta-D-mannosaminyltransferase